MNKRKAEQQEDVVMSRNWSMPNKETFTIKPIKEIIEKYMELKGKDSVWIDPFVRNSVFKDKMKHTNDLNPEFIASHHMDALDFLRSMPSDSFDGILFDPPYSPRQISECYKGIGKKVCMQDTQSSFYSNLKDEISRILKKDGVAICCGWNSNGVGIKRKFALVEILLVPHGGAHNDTIVTVEKKE